MERKEAEHIVVYYGEIPDMLKCFRKERTSWKMLTTTAAGA